ncbi:MAG: tRNA uridine-5-carboxymethylaminomethyl(34) synthesis GTPase MnmE [Methylotenera sp. 24-45-7]|nr:MAG: tRNA uridine-5-carboxymethylaminomethyl(34) synthesis GTPase MnmE [Mehylophilales bacterium 35-46-6]OYZ39533.1 MAG: tRNA uridine-5-carboxymethylaminomethyl(34) synthesis GTPase MnmE [Methylotenera sp. 24-45-7]OZA08052.1 MAG: tRNA uridine-5-carboxymethylaminomethyl(34) synthesis GTPase MnmE [Methylotenera sp. 17-45-7]HQS44569.1 tRNA uridine-5-carboxymethylaminomethyl(34) synthesis GTPase MnmE [Methylotenera sp.]
MNTSPTDTIAAIATASGAGGIGVVRVSGALSKTIANEILGHCPAPRHAAYLDFKQANGDLLDRGIAIFYPNPHSYTGEDVLELQAHGGTALMQILLARCISLGARQAEPGEFTRRAYLNDKMDLAQAEAVADVINAATVEAAKSAVRSLSGEFSQRINALLLKLIDLRMYVEACLDFPEEEIDFITQGRVGEKLAAIIAELNAVFVKAKQGSLLREGINVVLVGQPNVGKSSLMNQLAGEEVAIVTAIAGTTRDTIKNAIQINGVPLHVIDTAGLRETDDEVEKFGIARTWASLETANIALLLVDAAHGITETEKSILERLPQEIRKIWVHNKIDVTQEAAQVEEKDQTIHIYISAKTGLGIDLLKAQLLKLAGYQNNSEGVFMARARHLQALTAVETHLNFAQSQINSAELVAEELRLAQESLSGITGEFTPDDLLGEIFSKFCIGK